MIKCSECGYENMDGLDYCDGCGAKLESAAASAGPAPALSSDAPAAAAPALAQPASATEPTSTAVESDAGAQALNSAASAEAEPGPSNQENAASETSAKAPTGELKAAPAPAAAVAETAPPPFKAKLAVIRGGRRGQEFELESGNNLVGRWDPETGSFPEVDLDADDPEAKISRKHALIRFEGGKITIEDIGSLNGTYVNRQPRLQPGNPMDLKDGDEIIIGKTFLKLSINPIS